MRDRGQLRPRGRLRARAGSSTRAAVGVRPAGRLPEAPLWVVGDRGLASHAFRERVWDLGARPAIPPKCNEEPVACPAWIYANRSRVERLWARLKEWRAVATRYEKTARAFMGVLCLAAAMDWLKGCTARP